MESNHDSPASPVPCAVCERAPGTVEALWDHEPVRVCARCFAYETGEDADDDEAA
jgi:hypothetical protein